MPYVQCVHSVELVSQLPNCLLIPFFKKFTIRNPTASIEQRKHFSGLNIAHRSTDAKSTSLKKPKCENPTGVSVFLFYSFCFHERRIKMGPVKKGADWCCSECPVAFALLFQDTYLIETVTQHREIRAKVLYARKNKAI